MNSHSEYGGFGIATIWDQTPPGTLKAVCNYVTDGAVVEIINNFFHLDNPTSFFDEYSRLGTKFFDHQPYPPQACTLLGFPGSPRIYGAHNTMLDGGEKIVVTNKEL